MTKKVILSFNNIIFNDFCNNNAIKWKPPRVKTLRGYLLLVQKYKPIKK